MLFGGGQNASKADHEKITQQVGVNNNTKCGRKEKAYCLSRLAAYDCTYGKVAARLIASLPTKLSDD
jgi:hypothetical protein